MFRCFVWSPVQNGWFQSHLSSLGYGFHWIRSFWLWGWKLWIFPENMFSPPGVWTVSNVATHHSFIWGFQNEKSIHVSQVKIQLFITTTILLHYFWRKFAVGRSSVQWQVHMDASAETSMEICKLPVRHCDGESRMSTKQLRVYCIDRKMELWHIWAQKSNTCSLHKMLL